MQSPNATTLPQNSTTAQHKIILHGRQVDINQFKTPFLALSANQAGQNYDRLQAALPGVRIHYAVKPNNHPAILREVYKRGGSFEVCSLGEMKKVLAIGVNPLDLIHTHPIKSVDEFDGAIAAGIDTFVIDNFEEARKLHRYTDQKLKILIRYRINTNSSAVVNLQYKFGCATQDVLPLAQRIREAGHEYCGLCFHIGSQCTHSGNYVKAIRTAHRLINKLDASGFDSRVLDIGGGFPVTYVEPVPSIEEFCKPIVEALKQQIRSDIKVISEPGRYIAASAATLVCSIIGKSLRDGKIWYYLDDGLYSTFSGQLYDQCKYPVITEAQGPPRLSVLSGPTCDSFDVMYDGLLIPEHEVGDKLIFTKTGAYCEVSGSNFNSLKRPDYIVVD